MADEEGVKEGKIVEWEEREEIGEEREWRQEKEGSETRERGRTEVMRVVELIAIGFIAISCIL